MKKLFATIAALFIVVLLSAPVYAAAALEFRYTVDTVSTSQSDPDASLGDYTATNTVSATSMNNVFDNLTGTELTSDVEYRALTVWNSGDATATNVELFMDTETSSTGTQIDLACIADTHGITEDLEAFVSESSTSGISVSFDHYTAASTLSLPQIPASYGVRIYLRRTVHNATATTSDLGTLGVQCD